jgi:hypothetical protein
MARNQYYRGFAGPVSSKSYHRLLLRDSGTQACQVTKARNTGRQSPADNHRPPIRGGGREHAGLWRLTTSPPSPVRGIRLEISAGDAVYRTTDWDMGHDRMARYRQDVVHGYYR